MESTLALKCICCLLADNTDANLKFSVKFLLLVYLHFFLLSEAIGKLKHFYAYYIENHVCWWWQAAIMMPVVVPSKLKYMCVCSMRITYFQHKYICQKESDAYFFRKHHHGQTRERSRDLCMNVILCVHIPVSKIPMSVLRRQCQLKCYSVRLLPTFLSSLFQFTWSHVLWRSFLWIFRTCNSTLSAAWK